MNESSESPPTNDDSQKDKELAKIAKDKQDEAHEMVSCNYRPVFEKKFVNKLPLIVLYDLKCCVLPEEQIDDIYPQYLKNSLLPGEEIYYGTFPEPPANNEALLKINQLKGRQYEHKKDVERRFKYKPVNEKTFVNNGYIAVLCDLKSSLLPGEELYCGELCYCKECENEGNTAEKEDNLNDNAMMILSTFSVPCSDFKCPEPQKHKPLSAHLLEKKAPEDIFKEKKKKNKNTVQLKDIHKNDTLSANLTYISDESFDSDKRDELITNLMQRLEKDVDLQISLSSSSSSDKIGSTDGKIPSGKEHAQASTNFDINEEFTQEKDIEKIIIREKKQNEHYTPNNKTSSQNTETHCDPIENLGCENNKTSEPQKMMKHTSKNEKSLMIDSETIHHNEKTLTNSSDDKENEKFNNCENPLRCVESTEKGLIVKSRASEQKELEKVIIQSEDTNKEMTLSMIPKKDKKETADKSNNPVLRKLRSKTRKNYMESPMKKSSSRRKGKAVCEPVGGTSTAQCSTSEMAETQSEPEFRNSTKKRPSSFDKQDEIFIKPKRICRTRDSKIADRSIEVASFLSSSKSLRACGRPSRRTLYSPTTFEMSGEMMKIFRDNAPPSL